MIQYMSARDAAEKWNVSQRRVSALCAENRIPDVAMLGNMWIIPIDAEKPIDARKNNGAKLNETAHPFVKWAGGKGQLIEVLKSNLPAGMGTEIKKYAEPFVGGGALLFSLLNEYTFEEVYINDNNKELMNVYDIVKRNCGELISSLRNFQIEYDSLDENERQKMYYAKRNRFNDISLCDETRVEKASLLIFLNKTCFNGLYRVNKSGKFNVPSGKYKNPTICNEKNLLKISNLLKNVTIHSCDYHYLKDVADSSTLAYIDPPYRPLNITSGFTSYTEDQFSDENQIELANFYKELSNKGVKIMLSNSDPKNTDEKDNFFDDLYSEFTIKRVEASRMINSKGFSRGKIKELLIKNY